MFQKINKEKLLGFLKKNGFYLVMAVCILGIGLGAFFGIGESQEPADEPSPSPQPAEQVQAIKTPTAAPSAPAATPTPSPTATAQAVSKARVVLMMPLEGEIVKAFSDDALVYNPTLNMWMTHNGIDIASAKDSAVKAALAGEVAAVTQDDSYGTVVELSHGTNGTTVYAGLSEASVAVGDKLNAGMQLGTVGTPPIESAQGAHLHFEYRVKDECRDPADYLR